MGSRRKSHPKFHDIHGILLLDKPLGLSSNAALQHARRLVGAAKGGHTGSLDPLATGLLPLCFGEATKLAGLLLGSHKAYEADIALGSTTTTADGEGEVTGTHPVPDFSDEVIEEALATLRGTITQVPPVYSAIKKGGVPLYRLAREGVEVAIEPRQVTVFGLRVISRQPNRLRLYVECSSGTYIRSIAVDLGQRLGCGAHVSALRRLWVDPFTEPAMITMEALEAAAAAGPGPLDACLLPTEAALAHLPSIRLDAEQGRVFAFGQPVPVVADPGRYAVFSENGRLMAVGEVGVDAILRSQRGLNLPEPE